MITRIGLAAGKIWEHLDAQDKPSQLGDIISSLEEDRDLVLMSMGWLAREGHIVMSGKGPNYTIKLSQHKGGYNG
ncbi:MAG: winged helix-turn-helix domain-containing protein [Candidatus Omnitrophica bacterium]|nr:winged helix-turn-helix domain-containing protein [Candidatus Omnitrophota bacterium]